MRSLPSHIRCIGLIAGLAITLTACTAPWGGGGPPVPVQPKLAGAKGLDVYAGLPADTRPRFRGTRSTEVTAYHNGRAVPDAECQISNDAFGLRFKSLQVLDLPDYGRASPPATVTCRKGDLGGEARLEVVNVSAELRQRRSGRGALPGAPMITLRVPLGRDDRPDDIWVYPQKVRVHLS
ncbi:hypothetical protein [Roseobacter sinensis]|uniref:Lipoprotein n=1 Tax=Roseobacter sinensis TaxID=2931391 RepID=A0ABT3BFM3_9RHOB|nr:hypothetical protein [Roseobacter sp. WL0113]MCV3272357.1 hypothetical protein [Roseobacter sp. WL0113]